MQSVSAGKDIDEEGQAINDVEKRLNSLGIALRDNNGLWRDSSAVIDEIASKWKTFTNVEQAAIATAVAGVRQRENFLVVMTNYDKVLKATQVSTDSAGTAQEKYGAYLDSTEAKLNQFIATWEEFLNNLDASGTIKDAIELGTVFINVLDGLVNKTGLLKVATVALITTGLLKLGRVIKENKKLVSGYNLAQQIFLTVTKDSTTATKLSNIQSLISAARLKSQKTALDSDTVSTVANTAAKTKAITVTGALNAVIKANPIGMALVAVTALTAGLYGLYNASQKTIESARNAMSALNDTTSEVKSLSEQFEETNQKIVELQNLETPTLSDIKDIDNLKLQNQELSLRISLLKEQQKVQARETSKTTLKSAQTQFGKYDERTGATEGGSVANINVINQLIRSYDELAQKKNKALSENDAEAVKQYDEELEKVSSRLVEYSDSVSLIVADFEAQKEILGQLEPEQEAYYQTLKKVSDGVQEVLNPAEYRSLKFSELINSEDFSTVKSQIDNLKLAFANGTIDAEDYEKAVESVFTNITANPALKQKLSDIGFTDEDFNNLDSFVNTFMQAFGIEIPVTVASFNEQFKNVKTTIQDLTTEGNTLSATLNNINISSLNDLDLQNIVSQVDAVNNGFQEQINVLENLMQSHKNNVDTAISGMEMLIDNTNILTGAEELSGSKMLDFLDKAKGIGEVVNPETQETINLYDILNNNLETTGSIAFSSTEDMNNTMGAYQSAALASVNAQRELQAAIINTKQQWMNTISEISNGIKSLANSSSFLSKMADLVSSNWRTTLNSLASSLDSTVDMMGASINETKLQSQAITQQESAVKGLSKSYGSALSNSIDKANKSAQNLQSTLKDAKSSIQSLLDDTISMLKQKANERKDILEEQKDALKDNFDKEKEQLENLEEARKNAYEKEKDRIESQTKAYQELIDKQIQSLEKEQEENKHKQELAEKTKAVSDIQAQLDQIALDDSLEAQRKRIELLKQLSEAQKNLTDYQTEYDINAKKDALQTEADRYDKVQSDKLTSLEEQKKAEDGLHNKKLQDLQDEYNRQKELLDQQTKDIDNYLKNEYNLRQEAIALIEGRTTQFYSDLLEWNRLYGTHIDQDIINKWNNAYVALDNYGMAGIGVQGVLETLTQQINNITSATSSAADQAERYAKALGNAAGMGSAQSGGYRIVDSYTNKTIKSGFKTSGEATSYMKKSDPIASKHWFVQKYHSGTDNVVKSNSWLDKFLGLGKDETAAILQPGEKIIPRGETIDNSRMMDKNISSRSNNTTLKKVEPQNHLEINVGDLIVEGNADENTLTALRKEHNSIVEDVFSRINKHQSLSGFRNIKLTI